MNVVDAKQFLEARDAMDPAGLAGLPETYEATWLAEKSPYQGRIHRLLFEDDQGIAVRIVVLQPAHGGEACFCFYGRRAKLMDASRDAFFDALRRWLVQQEIDSLQGPIQFSTWHPYRFVCGKGSSPWFPGEQVVPAYAYHEFLTAGFEESARYGSTLVPDLANSIEVGLGMGVERMLGDLEIETVSGAGLTEVMPLLYRLSVEVFRDNYAYDPIDFENFLALYEDRRAATGDAVVIIARFEGWPAGLAFSYDIGPYAGFDGESAQRTAVLKTIGVHPDARRLGIGYGVSYLTHRYWLERGYRQIIHAYMKTDNASMSMSAHFGRAIREYALLRWRLAA